MNSILYLLIFHVSFLLDPFTLLCDFLSYFPIFLQCSRLNSFQSSLLMIPYNLPFRILFPSNYSLNLFNSFFIFPPPLFVPLFLLLVFECLILGSFSYPQMLLYVFQFCLEFRLAVFFCFVTVFQEKVLVEREQKTQK